MSDALISLGPLVNTHGIRGELRLLPYNPDSTTIRPGLIVVLERSGTHTEHRVAAVRRHKRFLLLTFDGCESIDVAQTLVGSQVCVRPADLPAAGANEIYHYELIGMRVVTTAGRDLGDVAEVLTVPSHDICVVRDAAREYLIPVIAAVIRSVDREHRRLVVEPPAGLIDE